MKFKNTYIEERFAQINPDTRADVNRSFDIANRIYQILQELGENQKFLADKLGKSESEISKWLSGTHNFTSKTIEKIESALGADILTVVKAERQSAYHWQSMLVSVKHIKQVDVIYYHFTDLRNLDLTDITSDSYSTTCIGEETSFDDLLESLIRA
jgi:transcriptional regulator with XRE-family HTH domain